MANTKFDFISHIEEFGHEQLVTFHDKETGLTGFTAIHNTNLGPALGGTRLWNYESKEKAIEDVLRLSRGMSYKNAAMGLPLGGGKTVIMGDTTKLGSTVKRDKFFQALGRFVESLNGRYVTAEDINVSTTDCVSINKQTNHVVGLPGKSGNPSPVTAFGVYCGMKEGALKAFGTDLLDGKTIAVQGAGQTGYYLIDYLLKLENPKKIYFTEINKSHIKRMKKEHPEVEFVEPDDIFGLKVDIFAPCAMGAQINPTTIKKLKCKLVSGSANNCLLDNASGDALYKKGITYTPDYINNGGGVVNVYSEIKGNYDKKKAMAYVKKQIRTTLKEVFAISAKKKIPEYKVADQICEKRMKSGKLMNGIYLQKDATAGFIKKTTAKLGLVKAPKRK